MAAKGRPQFWFARFRATTGGATWLDMTQEYSDPSEFGSSGRVGLVPGVTRAGDSRNPPRTCQKMLPFPEEIERYEPRDPVGREFCGVDLMVVDFLLGGIPMLSGKN